LASDDGFLFQYFGGEFEAALVALPAPKPDTTSVIEIWTRLGLGVDLRVTDEEEHPIAGAAAATQWSRNDQWSRIDWRTDSKGQARLSHLPNGEVFVRVRKPGYVPKLETLFRAEEWVGWPLAVKLRRAATVKGKCTLEGKPVHKFTVFFFANTPPDGGKIVVDGSEDGSFTIDEAPPGAVQLIATCEDVVQSSHVSVTVQAGAVGHAELEFSAPRTLVGQIVDASSGEAVTSARVAAMVHSGWTVLKPWKAAQAVGKNGSFELAGFAAVEGLIRVEAPGYATRQLTVWPTDQQRLDIGRIAVHRSQMLTVHLNGAPGVDLSGYSATLSASARYVPGVRFSADGVVRFEAMAPGEAEVIVEGPDGHYMRKSIRVRPSGTTVCEFTLTGQPLDVEVVPASGAQLPEGASLIVVYVDSRGEHVDAGYPIPKSGQLHLEALDTDRIVLQVFAPTSVILATRVFALPTEGPRRVLFEMRPSPQRLRVVGPGRNPIAGSLLVLRGAPGSLGWLQSFTTDAQGEASVPDIGPGPVTISVFNVDHGVLPCTPISAADAKGGVLEIMLPRGTDVDVEFRDGADALQGVEMELRDSCGAAMSGGRSLAGPDGRVHLTHLAPGDYRVLVDHPGIWRTEHPITVTATSTNFTVQLRRLGSARIHAKSGAGNPVEGASVELVDVLTGASVANWIEKGEVVPPENGLRTDAGGTLVINGLPRGSYRCVLTSPSGATLERSLEVPAQAMGELKAVLQ